MGYQRIMLCGNMCSAAELKQTPSGVSVTRFRLAVSAKIGGKEETKFFSIVAWRQTAEFVCKYGAKGRKLLCSGRAGTNTWKDREGKFHAEIEITADEVTFVDSGEKITKDGQATTSLELEELAPDETLPF